MKIVLISPSGPMYGKKGIFPRALRYAPLTLTTLAGLIPKELNAEVEIIDGGISPIPNNIQADLIGISAITGTVNRSYFLADYFRKKGITVVLGGIHPTLMPEEALKHADSVVLGLAYETWPQLLKDFKKRKLKRVYKEQNNLNISSLPYPRRDLIPKYAYITRNSIQATFGCPNCCDFCAVAATQKKYLHRPIKDVISEIKKMNKEYIALVDPSPIENKDYAKKLFKEMIPLKRNWGGLATVKIVDDDELLDLTAKSGCKGLLVGFETISQDNLIEIDKNINNAENYKKVIKKLHDKGIAINGTFMFGMDNDTKDIFDRTVKFVNDTYIDLPRYSIYTPFPGTPAFNKFEKEGRILTKDWSLYDGQHVVFKPKNMTPEELRKGALRAWEKTYTLKSIIKRIIGSRCSPLITLITNFGYRYYARRLKKFTNDYLKKIELERNSKFIQ